MKNGDYTRFWHTTHEEAEKKHTPLRVMFELTYKCNFHCRHCYIPAAWRKKKDLTTPQIFQIINELKKAGCFYLGFTGGEIFTRPDIWKILEFSRASGMQVILYTNGSLINAKAAEKIAAIGVNKVDITLPGFSDMVFNSITGVKGSCKKVFAAIKYLKKNKIPVGFKTCVLKANHGEIEKIKKFCVAMKARYRLDDCPSPRLDGSLTPLRLGVKTNTEFYKTEAFKCTSGISQCAITPQGRLKLCPMINWPNLNIIGDDFIKTWSTLPTLIKNNPRQKDNKSPYTCPGCVINYSPGKNHAKHNKI